MAANNNEMDTTWAKTISQIMGTNLSLYSPGGGHQILENVNIIPIPYGKRHITRPVSDPFDDVVVDRRFAAPDQLMEKRVQDIDLVCVSKRIVIDAVDYAADPALVAIQVSDALNILKDGIEKYWINGSTTRMIMLGVNDTAVTGSTTINDMIEVTFTSDGDWSTITNLQSDLGHAEQALIDKGFYGPFMLILPASCQPLLSQVQTSTAVPASEWISGALGLKTIFTPATTVAAAWTFTAYVIDVSKVHLGMTDLKVDSFYSNKDHSYIWDMEVYMSALFDPIHDGTDYVKGVCSIDADWRD